MTSRSPFFPRFEQLGETIPIFPLVGVLLLPRGLLPLNIFEPRYVAMVDDALCRDRLIGMIQPVAPDDMSERPPVYPIGCAGRITAFNETDDGRYLITLTGICRFRVADEQPAEGGFRRARADWRDFAGDFAESAGAIDRDRLLAGLRGYFRRYHIQADWDTVRAMPDDRLVTSLAMTCPFEPQEKQALLEARDLPARAALMTDLIEMAVLGDQETPTARH